MELPLYLAIRETRTRRQFLPIFSLLILSPVGIVRAQDVGMPILVSGERLTVDVTVPPSGVKIDDTLATFGPTDPIAENFNVILFRGQSADKKVVFEASLQPASPGQAPRWIPAEISWFNEGHFWGRFLLSGPAGAVVSFRLRSAGIKGAQQVSISRFEAALAEREGSCLASRAVARGAPISLDQGFTILPRDAWGAECARGPYEAMRPVRITIHHTSDAQRLTKEEGIQEMRIVQNYHQKGRGWIDIAYHFAIDGAGDIFQGRPEFAVGSHVLRENEGNIGIVLMGNFDHTRKSNLRPTARQMQALKALVRWLVRTYPTISLRDPDWLHGHRDYLSGGTTRRTSCPGDNLYAQLADVKRAVIGPFRPEAGGSPARRIQKLSSTKFFNLPFENGYAGLDPSGTLTVLFDERASE